ncbi:MAG: uroporphyrinogen decarboxylase [Phycisphaerae bacterium]|nr:uroporphyrinogen decarboxylase [Phycisphaerae bacterium]
MNHQQWQQLLDIIEGKKFDEIPIGFIIDSPWLPGWAGCSLIDYYSSDRIWLDANFKAINTFPDITFLPGFWSEYGMCTEPSAFGSKMVWSPTNLPHAMKTISDISEIDRLTKPNVKTDGMLPFVINRLKNNQQEIQDNGHQIKFAISRGPLNIASFLMGTTEFLMAMMIDPKACHKLLALVTDFVTDWIDWQMTCFSDIEGILLLDDIIGFVGKKQCQEFVVPYFQKIYKGFDAKVNFLHNDAAGITSAPFLEEMNVNMFNFSHEHTLTEMKELTGNRIALLGNIPPRDVLAAGSAEQVAIEVQKTMASIADHSRVMLSCGGGMPPDVSTENIRAFQRACQNGRLNSQNKSII